MKVRDLMATQITTVERNDALSVVEGIMKTKSIQLVMNYSNVMLSFGATFAAAALSVSSVQGASRTRFQRLELKRR